MADEIRVLHVDDDPEITDLTAEFLSRADDRLVVESATSAEDGLDRLSEAVDCVVSDYEMPGADGIEFLNQVRDRHDELPFILFTGKGNEEVASEAISAGVTDYLQKTAGTDQYKVLANRITNAVDHHRSQHLLERSRSQLRAIVDNLPHLLFVVAEDGTYELANDALATFHETTIAEIEGASVYDLLDSADADHFMEDLTDVIESGEPRRVSKIPVANPNGEERIFDSQLLPYELADSRQPAVLGITIDVTERVQRERMLRRYEALVDELQDAVVMLDGHGEYVFVNQTLGEWIPPGEWTGRSPEELAELGIVAEDDAAAHQAVVDRILAGSTEVASAELTVTPPDGGIALTVDLRYSSVRNGDGELVGVVGTARGETE